MTRTLRRGRAFASTLPLIASLILLGGVSCATRPAATFEVVEAPLPEIESITHGAPNGARSGDTVSLTLTGDNGLIASASLPGLASSIPLSEDRTTAGLYRGSLIVPEGKAGVYNLTGRLEAEGRRAAVLDGPPLRVHAPPPPARARMTAQDFNAQKALRTIYFEFDKYNLRDDALRILQANASWLREHTSFRLVIEGHCDERGTNEYNMALGDRRANAARSYLVDAGIAAGRIRTISYGEERAVDPGHNDAAWARNRRAEFVLED